MVKGKPLKSFLVAQHRLPFLWGCGWEAGQNFAGKSYDILAFRVRSLTSIQLTWHAISRCGSGGCRRAGSSWTSCAWLWKGGHSSYEQIVHDWHEASVKKFFCHLPSWAETERATTARRRRATETMSFILPFALNGTRCSCCCFLMWRDTMPGCLIYKTNQGG